MNAASAFCIGTRHVRVETGGSTATGAEMKF